MNWHVLRVSARQEKAIARALQVTLGDDVYIPLLQCMGREREYTQPLLIGYLFVRANPVNLEMVKRACGILDIVKYKTRYAEIGADVMSNITRLVNAAEQANTFEDEGKKVKIKMGIFAEIVGMCESIDNESAAVIVRILGNQKRVRVPRSLIDFTE